MTLTGTFRKPFDEQVAAFRLRLQQLKLTETWEEVWQSQHDRAFMVAGTMKADLLADLAAAVDRAVVEGTTLEAFRKDFRAIVERRGWHGWTGEGTKRGEAWRTRVIYKTNLATSYSAGRWAQLKAAGFPLLVYRHGGSRDPRIEHLGWDGLILPAEHPFWATHAPPNGWGCSCYVLGARSEAGAIRLGGKPGKTLQPGWDALSPKTGAPVGIDRGWAYAPGATVVEDIAFHANKLNVWPYLISKALMRELPKDTQDALGRAYRQLPSTADTMMLFAQSVIERGPEAPGIPPIRTLGMVPTDQLGQIVLVLDRDLQAADFAVTASAVRHVDQRHSNARIEQSRNQRPVTLRDWARLARVLDEPDQIEPEGMNGPNQVLRYSKAFPDGVITVLLEVRAGRQRLALLTMYVRAAGSDR